MVLYCAVVGVDHDVVFHSVMKTDDEHTYLPSLKFTHPSVLSVPLTHYLQGTNGRAIVSNIIAGGGVAERPRETPPDNMPRECEAPPPQATRIRKYELR